MDQALLEDIRSRINPQYQDIKGTESYERKQMVDEIDLLKAELEGSKANCKMSFKQICELHKQLAEARAEIETSNLRSVELIQQAYQNASRSILNDPLVTTYIAPDGLIYKQLLKRYGLEGEGCTRTGHR